MALRNLAISGLVLATGVSILAACSYDDQRAALKPAPGYGLYYNDAGPTASLAYGQANSDNVALMLECAKGSGRVQVSDLARSGPAAQIVLASGGARSPLAARMETSEGPAVLVAYAAIGAPALDGFRRTGRIDVAYGDVRYGVSADRAEQGRVQQFFAACQRA
jgi:hypothetical protein